jgi:hypothetical protein
LQQLYDLRSCAEHIKNYERVLRKPRGVSRDQALGFWTLAAELLAGDVYKRVFLNADLRECFRNEATTAGFWRRNSAGRTGLIGDPLDLWALARDEFRQAVNPPWP